MARSHAGHLNHAVVLRKSSQRQRAQRSRNHRHQTICQYAAAQTFGVFLTLNRLLGDHRSRRQIANCLKYAQQENRTGNDKRVPIKCKTIFKRNRQGNQRQVLQGGKIYFAQKQRNNITDNQTHRDTAHTQQWIFQAVENQYNQQHQRCQTQVFHRAERTVCFRTEAAAEIGNADMYQAQTNQHDDHTAYSRRNHFFQIRQKPSREAHQKRADKGHAQKR